VSDLPSGWALARFTDVVKNLPTAGHVAETNEIRASGSVPVITQGDASLDGYIDDFSRTYTTGLPLIIFGDHTRAVKLSRKPFAVGPNAKVLSVSGGLNPDFLYYQFPLLLPKSRGYGRHYQFLAKSDVAVAPAAEQERIVAAIEEQFSRLDAGVIALERVRQNLRRMRAALLAAACSGRLTVGWRDNHGVLSTGSQFLQELLVERTDHGLSRGKMKKAVEPVPGIPPDLPATWTRASVDQLCSTVTDGEHLTPRRTDTGVMLLSARNVLNGHLSFDVVDHISEETYRRLAERLEVTSGDVLLSCSGTVGRSTVVPDDVRFALVRSVAVLRPWRRIGQFVSLMLRSPQLQEQINNRKTETAQANIFQGQIRALTLPLPPVEEQEELVRSVDRQMTLISALERAMTVAVRRSSLLRSSILSAAFSGKLVPQDPNDEPASVLLGRVAAERSLSNGHQPSRKSRRTRVSA
jgi:type I restriction enzyme, S subunit